MLGCDERRPLTSIGSTFPRTRAPEHRRPIPERRVGDALPIHPRMARLQSRTRADCPIRVRYATTSASRWLHLAEGFERKRGTLQSSHQSALRDQLTTLDRVKVLRSCATTSRTVSRGIVVGGGRRRGVTTQSFSSVVRLVTCHWLSEGYAPHNA